MRQLTRLAPLAALAASAGVVACASASSPPGGPPDTAPPAIIAFSPDSGAVGFTGRSVTVTFNETISDRGTGANALEALVLISPRDGAPQVAWHRNRIAVRPRGGFRPNTAYAITIAPGIGDLRGNRSSTGRTVMFSTGATIPAGEIAGRVFDWPGQQVARLAWIEALRTSDSAVFVTTADSTGAFTVGALNPGTYVVRGYVDQNANRVLDRVEVWDSVRVAVGTGTAAGIELLLARRDTIPARITALDVVDSVTLRAEFDKPLDPNQSFAEAVRIVRADSTPVRIAAVRTPAAHAAARAGDTGVATPRDSSAATPPRIARDSGTVRPTPSRAAPPSALVILLADPLQPRTTYRVTLTAVRSLLGTPSSVTRVLTTAAPDSAAGGRRAAPDPQPARSSPAPRPGRR